MVTITNYIKLKDNILKLSLSNNWFDAKKEWKLDRIEIAEKYGDKKCACDHKIKEICYI